MTKTELKYELSGPLAALVADQDGRAVRFVTHVDVAAKRTRHVAYSRAGLGSMDHCRRSDGPRHAGDWRTYAALACDGFDGLIAVQMVVMATADQVKALITSHADGDDARFYAIAIQVAAQAARSGHANFAKELRDLVDKMKARGKTISSTGGAKPVPLAQPRGELVGLLTVVYTKTRLADMALTDELRERLERVLTEQRQRDRLREHGLPPLRKLLLIGPPGTGKTMTARALAGELGVPLLNIQLDGLITKFMGETAAKLRLVFDAVQSTRGVYLFDEFDALGGERGSKNDVGEIRRVLNSFLQFLEQDESDSLVLAATNHVGLLDRALFRRFDAQLAYSLPSANVATHVMKSRLALLNTSEIDWNHAALAADGLSHSEIAAACEQAAKNAILDHSTSIRESDLATALKERHSTHA